MSTFVKRTALTIAAALPLLGAGTLAASALAAPGEGCPNEAVRAQSNINPTTSQTYSQGLPECRAYEMVSPLDKQQHDAITIRSPLPVSVSPDGTAIQWSGQGDYAGAENYQLHTNAPGNPYVAQRTASGWTTRSGYAPASVIEYPFFAFQSAGVYSPDLSRESICGTVMLTGGQQGPTIGCALREPGGAWSSTPSYTDLTGQSFDGVQVIGASRNTEDIVLHGQPGRPFLSADTSGESCIVPGLGCGGLYEVSGVGTQTPELRLVNVDNAGNMIGPESPSLLGAGEDGAQHAVSADGSKIYFTATPAGGVPTLFARIDGAETVTVSAPECEGKCVNEESEPASFQGASADGTKVFFTTAQQLVSSDTDSTPDLYEYNFDDPLGHRLTQVSRGGLGDVAPGAGAEVEGGVVSVSEDGSHVYFVAHGVLTTLPNGLGQTATAASGASDMYGYDTTMGETQFVAPLLGSDGELWGAGKPRVTGLDVAKLAQTTSDGRYLVFDSFNKLIVSGPEADTSGAQQVYRYDFQTGQILRISTGHEGFADNGNTPGGGAVIGPADDLAESGSPTTDGRNRSISEDGVTIAFVTSERLQSSDVVGGTNQLCDEELVQDDGAGCEVYLWHECPHGSCAGGGSGEVNMISDGKDPAGAVYAGMSANGSDIFFQTRTQLVGQDTDSLGDIYDARVDGGFPAPTPEPSCTGESCQGAASPAAPFAAPGTVGFTGNGNLTPGATSFPPATESKPTPKPPTKAQELAKALGKCKGDRRKKPRVRCERAAKKKYGRRKTKG